MNLGITYVYPKEIEYSLLFNVGVTLLFLETGLIFTAGVLLTLRHGEGTTGGAFLMIDFFPVVLGSDVKIVKILMVMAIVLLAIVLVMNVLLT